MKLKKMILLLIGTILIILLGNTNVEATLKFNNLDFNVQLNSDGSMDVIETWDIYISETNTLYKTMKIDKSKYDSITNFSVKEITSGRNNYFKEKHNWAYHLPKDFYFGGINNDGQYEVSWGVGLDNSSATRKYEIRYTVLDVIHKYGDCSELYWQFLGDDAEIPADKITGTIKLPYSLAEKEDIKVWGHTKDLNGEIYAADGNTVKFELSKYRAKHFIEVRIVTPTYVFEDLNYTSYDDKLEDIEDEEIKWAEEANKQRKKRELISNIVLGAELVVLGLISLVCITKIPKYSKKLKNSKKILPTKNLEYYRDLPDENANPAEAMFILSKHVDTSKALSATLLNLALKKYIEFKQEEKNIYVTIQNENISALKEDEKEIMNLLFKVKEKETSNTFTMKQLEKYVEKHPTAVTKIEKEFQNSAKKYAEEKDKFKKEIEKKGTNFSVITFLYAFFAFMIIGIGAVPIILVSTSLILNETLFIAVIIAGAICVISMGINAILTGKLSSRYNGFTQKGIDEKEEWRAFKKYMLDFSLLNEKEVPHLILWERFLVFATAFGIAEKVIKQLKIKYPELSNPDTTNNMIILGTLYSGGNFNTNFISSINSSTSNMYSSYSSGTGGGGGFSGGGGGRWPEVDGCGGR